MLTASLNTLGFPDWTLAQMAAFCQAQRVPYIEIRALENSVDLLALPVFSSPQRIAQARALLHSAGVRLLALNSGFHLQEDLHPQRDIIARYAALAQDLGADYIRFFSGGQPQQRPDLPRLAAGWQLVEEILARSPVRPLVETHDSLVHSEDIAALNQRVGGRLNVLWDFAHTTNYGGETWQMTWDKIGPLVRYLHVKDTLREPSASGSSNFTVRNVCLGQGELPVASILAFFAQRPAETIVSLEWEKMWDPRLSPGAEAAQTFLQMLHSAAQSGQP